MLPHGQLSLTRLVVGIGIMTICGIAMGVGPQGTQVDPIIDSAMTREEALEGLDPTCPREIRERQVVVDLLYYGADMKVHRGQLVVDRDLAEDVSEVFDLARRAKFPIRSIIPISHPRFRKGGRWDDDLSMEANNTSAFNFRPSTGGSRLSNHAYGRAIDLNPLLNPYIKGTTILPPGASHDPRVEGTLTADHPIVDAFVKRGWSWGGNWKSPKDYQHFEKPTAAEKK